MIESRKISLEVAALTHLGKVRPSNEDAVAVAVAKDLVAAEIFGPKRFTLSGIHCVLMIADGMGGHSAARVSFISTSATAGCIVTRLPVLSD